MTWLMWRIRIWFCKHEWGRTCTRWNVYTRAIWEPKEAERYTKSYVARTCVHCGWIWRQVESKV